MKKVKQIKYLDFPREVRERKKEYFEAIERVLYSGRFILGKEVEAFEKEFARFLKIKYCVGVGTGLEAIQISLMALGIKGGDEVITTPLSAVATTLAILAVRAKPVFVDINEKGQIDASLIEEAITKNTKAVLPVHLYGQPCEIGSINNICEKHKLFLIEDAAQAHGSTFIGKNLGTFGNLGAFSFYPTKNLGAFGDGGAIITNNASLAKACREIRDYGQSGKYKHTRYGLNSRLDELHAALLRVKLRFLKKDNKKRLSLAKCYVENLSQISGIEIVLPEKISDSNFHLFVIKVKRRDELQKYLLSKGIQTLVHYPATIPDQPFLKKDFDDANIDTARKFVKKILSLPISSTLSNPDISYVTNAIKDFFKK